MPPLASAYRGRPANPTLERVLITSVDHPSLLLPLPGKRQCKLSVPRHHRRPCPGTTPPSTSCARCYPHPIWYLSSQLSLCCALWRYGTQLQCVYHTRHCSDSITDIIRSLSRCSSSFDITLTYQSTRRRCRTPSGHPLTQRPMMVRRSYSASCAFDVLRFLRFMCSLVLLRPLYLSTLVLQRRPPAWIRLLDD